MKWVVTMIVVPWAAKRAIIAQKLRREVGSAPEVASSKNKMLGS